MDRKYHALVCCRAGMGSSMMLKIKCDQVIKEDNLPIETEHGNLDSIIGFRGDLVITMIDLTEELSQDPPRSLRDWHQEPRRQERDPREASRVA